MNGKTEYKAAVKTMDEIIANIHDTVDIEKIIKPVYNFKAAENSNRKAKSKSGAEEEADASPDETD